MLSKGAVGMKYAWIHHLQAIYSYTGPEHNNISSGGHTERSTAMRSYYWSLAVVQLLFPASSVLRVNFASTQDTGFYLADESHYDLSNCIGMRLRYEARFHYISPLVKLLHSSNSMRKINLLPTTTSKPGCGSIMVSGLRCYDRLPSILPFCVASGQTGKGAKNTYIMGSY